MISLSSRMFHANVRLHSWVPPLLVAFLVFPPLAAGGFTSVVYPSASGPDCAAYPCVTATVTVGPYPANLAYDSGKGEIISADGSYNISIVGDSTDRVVGTVYAGFDPSGIAYDEASGDTYLGEVLSGNIAVFSDRSDSIVQVIPWTPNVSPDALVYDSGVNQVFVANRDGFNVSVISPQMNNSVTASIDVPPYPYGLTYVAALKEVFVESSGNVSVISDVTDRVVDTIHIGGDFGPYAGAYDSNTGELFTTNGIENNVSVINVTTDKIVATIPLTAGSDGIAYDSGNGDIYVVEDARCSDYPLCQGNVSVISGASLEIVKNLPVGDSPGDIVYDSARAEMFVANVGSGTLSVIADHGSGEGVDWTPIAVGVIVLGVAVAVFLLYRRNAKRRRGNSGKVARVSAKTKLDTGVSNGPS